MGWGEVRRLAVALVILLGAACSNPHHGAATSPSSGGADAARTPAAATLPKLHFSNVVLIMLENQEEPNLIGNGDAPYLSQLAAQHTLLSQSYAITHPSLPNYLALISGHTFGVTQDCNTCFQSAPTLADQLEAAGRTWMGYFEDMPAPCTLGDGPDYVQHHNPFVYFDAIRLDAARCQAHTVPFTQLVTEIAAGSLPDFAWISPNLCHDLHNCGPADGDAWLAQTVPQLLATPPFQPGGAGLLIITTDEGTSNAGCCGDAAGGHIATVLVSPLLPSGTVIDTPVSPYGLLRMLEDNWGLAPLGHAAEQPGLLGSLSALPAAGP
jgi:hypothetical protein